MKKQPISILILLSFLLTSNAQQNTFSKVLVDTDCNATTKIFSVCTTNDSSYIIVGYNMNQGIILKIDSKGGQVWEKQVGDPEINHFPYIVLKGVTVTPDSCFIISGYTCTEGCGSTNALCFKINNDGDILWSKTYNYDQASEFTSVRQTSDSGYVMTGSINNEQKILVSKINATGDLVWTNILQSGNHTNTANSIKENVDGSFIIAGYTEHGPPFSFHPFITKLSSAGNILWAKQYYSNNSFYGAVNDIEFFSGGMLLHSYNQDYTVIIETDSLGNIQWSKLYDIYTNYLIGGTIPKIHKTHDNGYVFINQLGEIWLSHITKIDSEGNIIWDKELEIDPIDLIETVQGEFFIPGNRLELYLPAQMGTNKCLPDIGLLKLDSLGTGQQCVSAGYTTATINSITTDTLIFSSTTAGTTDTLSLEIHSEITYESKVGCAFEMFGGIVENTQYNEILVFPNPSKGIITIETENRSQGQLTIYNGSGQRIFEAMVNKPTYQIDLQNQPDGIYFLSIIYSNDKPVFGKFEIRK